MRREDVSVPVGGHLSYYAHTWENIITDPFVLNVISHGYALVFDDSGPPNLSCVPLSLGQTLSPQAEVTLQLEAEKLLAKCAIEVTQDPSSQGFYICLFLVDKRDGGCRLVIDLSAMNKHLEPMSFKMVATSPIMVALRQGEWTTSLDLKDAYFHIPVAKSSRSISIL